MSSVDEIFIVWGQLLQIAYDSMAYVDCDNDCDEKYMETLDGLNDRFIKAMARIDNSINFNDKIKVKLTDLGKDIFYYQYDWILEQNPKTRAYIKPHYPKVDEEGYTTFLLWQFMQLYGKHIGMGAPNVILPLEIIRCEDE